MKFSEIEPFIRDGEYQVDVSLCRLEGFLNELKEAYGLELNPDFQRGNVWTEEQQIAFIEFFLRGGKTARIVYFNSPVYGVYNDHKESDLDDTVICVDGLQRITALLRFLRNEIPVFGHYFREYEDRPRMTQTLKININALKTRAELLEWYIQFNSGGTVHTKEEIDRVKALLELELSK